MPTPAPQPTPTQVMDKEMVKTYVPTGYSIKTCLYNIFCSANWNCNTRKIHYDRPLPASWRLKQSWYFEWFANKSKLIYSSGTELFSPCGDSYRCHRQWTCGPGATIQYITADGEHATFAGNVACF